MSRRSIDFNDIYFCYDTASHPLFEKLNITLPAGWTGIVGANGIGKTTFLRLATGQLKPQKKVLLSFRNLLSTAPKEPMTHRLSSASW